MASPIRLRSWRRLLSTSTLASVVMLALLTTMRPVDLSGGPQVTAGPCTALCDECDPNGVYSAVTNPNQQNFGHVHLECNMINCDDTCSGDNFAAVSATGGLGAMATQLADTSPLVLNLALQVFPEVISYNEDRQAFQLRGCQGELIAHIPASRGGWGSVVGD